ncbi:dihydroxyacetone kinase family protein [Nonomuraea glycinis]|uniref:D-erythrulose kinase n=1 Tax=Nonomuraea glycinis TaxID=2047744 RepID=A0A918AEJ3_9ACTN|nr:dihydroxyacetone kinase family protein [Nonomuraea glycinis]MCA2178531.1 dihydroxyacetone kinase family protein [Nonomuraea glycinis]GGP14024.1 D-erythrulose kinase [Nonomuraea glycinis]
MTRLYDDPSAFTEDMLAGFLDVHRGSVAGVPGGVVRATETPPGKVAVVVGGGSGHYPAFCGVVGPGFADGAVVGNIFTSPSAQDAYSVGKAAASDAGLIFSTGNYAGDVMNFTLAQQRLCQEGIDTRVVFVTDDIASAPPSDVHARRGIAGDFVVFKVAGAAAEAGYDLDAVERVARHANDRTRTLGVAFGGCTMPGGAEPLFTVPPGRMGVGLGIHGEPGVGEDELPRAADLARRLVSGVLAEKPAGSGARVAAILNGLGTTKYEELFVVWRTVAALLAEEGLEVVAPEVGELVTSLDMAGCSLTLVFLDEELERLWCAPADTPAYRRGRVEPRTAAPARTASAQSSAQSSAQEEAAAVVSPSTPGSRACGRVVVEGLEAVATAMAEAEGELGRIDAVAGDGDHGRGMVKGSAAALAAARDAAGAGAGARSVLVAAGEAWAAKAGGTSGVLWGAALCAIGERLGDDRDEIAGADVTDAVRAGLDALQRLGGARPGDKTMIDAFAPFADALAERVRGGTELAAAWREAAEVCEAAARATAALRPRVGRARPLAERSVGTPDAGATSLALCAHAVAGVLSHAR